MDALVKTGWFLYQIMVNTVGPPLVAAASLKGRFGGRWRDRLGLLAAKPGETAISGGQNLWFHAASVGETRSAAVVIQAFLEKKPEWRIYFSIGTPAGLAIAEDIFKNESRVSIVAGPFDFWSSPGRAMETARPRAMILWETELWPNLIKEAKRYGALVILAAGKMTWRSFKRYRRVRHFMADLLNRFDLIAPTGSYEKDLFLALGAPENKTTVLGNPKFDRLAADADSEEFRQKKEAWRVKLWGQSQSGHPLIVAGSTHHGEEELILAAFKRLKSSRPNLKLILAPRHLGRVNELLALAAPFSSQATSRPGPLFEKAGVLVLDSLGQLNALYGLSDIALVGGSLAAGLTGHNPLEPAAVAKPIIFGPYMNSFKLEAEGLLEAGGARLAAQPGDLELSLQSWLDDLPAAEQVGRAGRAYLQSRPPAAPNLTEAIITVLES